MIGKQELLSLMERECRVCIRVFSKMGPESYGYKPTEGQRTTFELIQYMSYAFAGAANAIAGRGWDWWKEHEAVAAKMAPADFADAMETQIEELRNVLTGVDDETFNNTTVSDLPWPTENTVGVELLENCLRWIIGYKMQLFLYARSNGVEMSTMDCWFLTKDA